MRAAESGFTLGEILLVLAIVGMLAAIAVPTYTHAMARSQLAALLAQAQRLHESFRAYQADHGCYPSTVSPPGRALDLATLSPLSTQGYFDQADSLTSRLTEGRLTAYDSPNIGGEDTQFWATLELRSDPRVVILVARTEDFPLDRGTPYDGVFQIVGSRILPLEELR